MQSLTANLSWRHWIELLSIRDVNTIKYYINQSEEKLEIKDLVSNPIYWKMEWF